MRNVVFDLDDTLYVSKELRSLREKAIWEFLGGRFREYVLLKKRCGTIESFKRMGFEKKDFFKIMESVPIHLSGDVQLFELFKILKEKLYLVVLSNSSERCVREILFRLGVLSLVDELYHGEHFERVKPDPECFFMVKKGDVCVGNDFRKDLEVPLRRGARTILVGSRDVRADFCVKDIYEAIRVIINNFK